MANGSRNEVYSIPADHTALNELAAPAPVQNSQRQESKNNKTNELLNNGGLSRRARQRSAHHVGSLSSENYDIPDGFTNLDELASPAPVQNPHGRHLFSEEYLEDQRSQEQTHEGNAEEIVHVNDRQTAAAESETKTRTLQSSRASKLATEFYTVSYLISFSIFGTLARLGLQALTAYPGTPVTTSELWANVGGSMIMGFLSEDRKLFRDYGRNENNDTNTEKRNDSDESQETIGTTAQTSINGSEDPEVGRMEAQKTHSSTKKIIPLYVGLTTGFC